MILNALVVDIDLLQKLINITGIDKILLNCECINGSIVNGIQGPILYSFVKLNQRVKIYTKYQELNFLKR